MIHLDTHVVAWLYSGKTERIPKSVMRRLERDSLVVSPMVELELQYLFEIKRVNKPGHVVIDDLTRRIELAISTAPFAAIVAEAAKLSWTRDPFDRLIAAQAICESAPLVTADQTIQKHIARTIWE